jgi:hypothetical protein
MWFNLTPDYVLALGSVWTLVTSICKTHLSSLLIDLLGTLVENPVTLDTISWKLSIPFLLYKDLDLATLWIYKISGTQVELVFLTHKMAISQNRIKWFHIWDLMVFVLWSRITVTVHWCATLHQSTLNDEPWVSYVAASFWYVIWESTWTDDLRWSDQLPFSPQVIDMTFWTTWHRGHRKIGFGQSSISPNACVRVPRIPHQNQSGFPRSAFAMLSSVLFVGPMWALTVDLRFFKIEGSSSYSLPASAIFVHIPWDIAKCPKLSCLYCGITSRWTLENFRPWYKNC